MLAGYIEPTSGSIQIDGMDFSKIALKTYYPHIGYLTQEPGVFDATIRENLMSALGEKEKEGKQVHQKKESSKVRNKSNISALIPSVSNTSNELKLKEEKKEKETETKKETETSTGESTTEARLIQALKLAKCDFVFELEK